MNNKKTRVGKRLSEPAASDEAVRALMDAAARPLLLCREKGLLLAAVNEDARQFFGINGALLDGCSLDDLVEGFNAKAAGAQMVRLKPGAAKRGSTGGSKTARLTIIATRVRFGNEPCVLVAAGDGAALAGNVLDSMPDYVSVHDAEYRIVDVNKALAEKLGKRREEIIGQKCHEVFHGICEPTGNCPHKKTMEKKTTVTECVAAEKLGCKLVVTTTPIINGDGVVATVHHAREVSDGSALKSAMNDLRMSDAEIVRIVSGSLKDLLPGVPARTVSKGIYNKRGLRERDGAAYRAFVDKYAKAIEKAVEQRILKVKHDLSSGLAEMADRLGVLKAGPRDVVEIHMEALAVRCKGRDARAAELAQTEARFIVIELMGLLVDFYRNQAIYSA